MKIISCKQLYIALGVLCFPGLLLSPPASGVAAGPDEHKVIRDQASGVEFSFVPGGCFLMGAEKAGDITTKGQPLPPRADELPRHEVCVDSFWLARTEVTHGDWLRVMKSRFRGAPANEKMPLSGVALEDVDAFLRQLNQTFGEGIYRLPTEAEWEFACRPGEPTAVIDFDNKERHRQLRAVAHYREQSTKDPAVSVVGSKAAHAYGVFDLLGNVWEWTADDYAADAYAKHARQNPRHVGDGSRRVLRGGSYWTDLYQTRCGARSWGVPGDGLATAGFRVLRVDRAARDDNAGGLRTGK